MLISRSRFWTIVSSRDPVYVAMCVIRASIFTDLLTSLPDPIGF